MKRLTAAAFAALALAACQPQAAAPETAEAPAKAAPATAQAGATPMAGQAAPAFTLVDAAERGARWPTSAARRSCWSGPMRAAPM